MLCYTYYVSVQHRHPFDVLRWPAIKIACTTSPPMCVMCGELLLVGPSRDPPHCAVHIPNIRLLPKQSLIRNGTYMKCSHAATSSRLCATIPDAASQLSRAKNHASVLYTATRLRPDTSHASEGKQHEKNKQQKTKKRFVL